jgi:heme exporter protein C
VTSRALSAVAKGLLGLLVLFVIWGAFFLAPAAAGFRGQSSRIVFFHVPQAMAAVLAFTVNLVFSIRYLRRRQEIDDIRALAAARLGLLFSVLATVTGSIFARIEWGMFWNWDPRETSITILLLVYLAYFALRQATQDEERRGTLAASYALLAFVTMPFLIFVVPRVYTSLHPNLVQMSGANVKVAMDSSMRIVLFSSMASFAGLFFWLHSLEVRLARLRMAADGKED